MNRRLFDHIDLRVRSLAEAQPFYAKVLPALGFPEYCESPIGVAYDAVRLHPKPEFIGLIEDTEHRPKGTRLAFWAESKEELDRIGKSWSRREHQTSRARCSVPSTHRPTTGCSSKILVVTGWRSVAE